MTTATHTWDDVRPGDTVTVKRVYNKRSFKIRVRRMVEEGLTEGSQYRFLVGERLRMSNRPSGRRSGRGLPPGQRLEFVHINDINDIERGEKS